MPADRILSYAQRERVDLIVVGTHGHTGVTRVLLGSVAERVARTSTCPVLTVPQAFAEAAPARSEAVTLPPRPERCLVCAGPSKDLICQACRERIRGEAMEHKLSEMRAGKR